ncbi:hypothetical protein [Sphingomonas hylomeconis]|uniref:Homogentisate 1,2-dioxygenase n=1 Tax=Sphingomonas hylomeconis TaxID=1395958 RepID=A0ABV7SYK1_9SPHN|nr:hypothetical protein [Sphingomonas hylomeconis]
MPMLLTALILAQSAMPMAHGAHGIETPEPVCVRAGDLPPAFRGWNMMPGTVLQPTVPVIARARPAARTPWAVRPAKPGPGAVLRFSIARAGVYQIGLSNGAWVDVVRGRRALAPIAHGHGPLCTGLRKIVDYRLVRGSYALQLAAMPEPTTRVMLVRR